MRLSNIQTLLARQWQRAVLYAVLLAAIGLMAFYNIGSLPGGYSAAELATAQQADGWRHIFDNPINAPFVAAVHSLSYLHDNALLLSRLVAGLCGMLTVVLFYLLVRQWHSEPVALFGTILFGVSAWFLHIARFGAPEVTLFGLLALAMTYLWLRRTGSGWALLAGFALVALLLYTPGMVWFIGLGVILQWKRLDTYFKRNLWAVTAGGLLLAAALTPLGAAVYHNPEIAKVYAGFPAEGWPLPMDMLRTMADVPVHLFLRGPDDPARWLGTLPILDFFTAAMFFLGGYLYLRNVRLSRFWLVAGTFIAGILLIGLGGSVSVTLLVPFVYLVATAGIGFMADRWMAVFPRNIIARSAGYAMLCVAVLSVCVYSFRHYFIAWPQAAATKAAHTVQHKPSGTIKQ